MECVSAELLKNNDSPLLDGRIHYQISCGSPCMVVDGNALALSDFVFANSPNVE